MMTIPLLRPAFRGTHSVDAAGEIRKVKTVYKVKDEQGLYSPGGARADSETSGWSATKGKVWQNRGQVYNHLNQYKYQMPPNWVVEKYEQITITRKVGEAPAAQFYADKSVLK